MQNIHRVTYALIALVLLTAGFSFATHRGMDIASSQIQRRREPPRPVVDVHRENLKWYPTAEYDEPEPTDPETRALRKERKRRHNKFQWLPNGPHPETAVTTYIAHGQFDFPALPVAKSDLIVLGDVLTAEAHLSENKRNVYSEFTIRVNTIFKTANPVVPTQNALITIERVGGRVRYPNGREVLYKAAEAGMPRVGGQYLFFLNTIPQSDDYTILTGYEIENNLVAPLDNSGQFEALRGLQETLLLGRLTDLVSKPQPN